MDYDEAKLVAFLLLLARGKKRIEATQPELSKLVGLSQQSVSRLLKKLEEHGYVVRLPRGRGHVIEVAPAGFEKVEELAGLALALLEEQGTIVLEGRVVSGLGEGRFYVSLPHYYELFEKLLGFKPYPGTLNVKLTGDSVWKRAVLDAVESVRVPGFSDEKRSYGGARLYAASVEGYSGPAAVVVPDRTSHPKDVIEVLAPVCLREVLGLKDGDVVAVRVEVGRRSPQRAQKKNE